MTKRFPARAMALLAVPALGLLTQTAAPAVAASHRQPVRPATTAAKATALVGYAGNGFGSYYEYDSAGGKVFESYSGGVYEFDFIDLAGIGNAGNVQITTQESTDYCVSEGWVNDGDEDEDVNVSCYTPAGVLDTSGTVDFDVTLARQLRKPAGVLDYSLVTTNDSRNLTGHGNYNSAGKTNRVKHLGTGRYEVFFPGPASRGVTGTVEVTPYRTGGGNCVDAGWTGTAAGQQVDVDCYTASGARQNDGFDVVYADGISILGQKGIATAAVEYPGTGWVMPLEEHYFSGRARVAGLEWSPGDYTVDLAATGGSIASYGGAVQAEAVSSKHDDHCYTGTWEPQSITELEVFCVNTVGNDVAVPFTLQWLLP
jgi:hypothetical protein